MRYDLVEKVLNDLKGIVPYKDNIIWEDFKSIRTLGRYIIKENKIQINEYLDDDRTIMNVIAHELIHAAGVGGHRLEFKEYMDKINSMNLDFKVSTNGKDEKLNTFKQKQKEQREKREEKAKSKPKKEYIIWCEECGYNYITNRKCHKLRKYRCPECYGKLRQKQYKQGKTLITRRLY